MTISEWVGSVVLSVLLGGGVLAGFVKFLVAGTEKRLQLHFDKQLEEVRSVHRRDEEALKATLQRSSDELAAVRATVLGGAFSRQGSLDQRRLQAVEAIWDCVVGMSRFRTLADITSSLKLGAVQKEAASAGPNADGMRTFAGELLKSAGFAPDEKIAPDLMAQKQRPFLDPMTWSLFSAYQLVVMHPYLRLTLSANGLGPELLQEPSKLLETVREALPEYTEFINEIGEEGISRLVRPLEERLLQALVSGLGGEAGDEGAIKRAQRITELARDALAPKAPDIPPALAAVANGQ